MTDLGDPDVGYPGGLFRQIGLDDRLQRIDHSLILNKIAQVGIFLFADRCFKRDRLLCDFEYLADLVQRQLHPLGNLFR